MKKLGVVLGVFLSLSIVACFDSETEILKQARTTQQGVLSKQNALVADLDKEIANAEKEISNLTQNPLDSAGIIRVNELSERTSMINTLKDEVVNYKLNLKEIPEGAAIRDDAFFKGMKDEEVLKLANEQDSLFNILKSQVESEML
jgi:cell division protein FtsB